MGIKKEEEKSPIVIMLEAYCREKRKNFDDLTKNDWRCAHVALNHEEHTLRGATVMRRIMDKENAKS